MLEPYKVAEETINEGLSPGARWALAIFSALFGLSMFFNAPDAASPGGAKVFGTFCIFIALACVTQGRVRQFIGSTIGVAIFSFALWYGYGQFDGGKVSSGSRGEPSIINAALFMLCFGIPGLTYAFKARFGFRRRPADEDET